MAAGEKGVINLGRLKKFFYLIKNAFVAKENGKGLSTNDYTTAEKQKLSGINAGAEVNTINTIKVNGTVVQPNANKEVNITVADPDLSSYATKNDTQLTGNTSAENVSTKSFTLDGWKITIVDK